MRTKLITTFIILTLFAVPLAVGAQDNSGTGAQNDEIFQTTNNQSTSSTTTSRSSDGLRAELEAIRKLNTATRQQKIAELKSKATQERCALLTSNVDRRLTYYDENYQTQLDRFKSLLSKTEAAIVRLEDLSYDVSGLRANFTELNEKVSDFQEIRAELVEVLGASKTQACGDGTGGFKTSIQNAATLVAQLGGKSREIKSFIQNDLKDSFENL